MSLIQDTIIWAQQHGIPTPGYTATGETTVEAAIREIVAAEQAFVRQFGLMIQARAQGLLRPTDIVRYDTAREQLFNAQKEFYTEYTSGRIWQALNALGAVRDIPAPQKAPPFSAFAGVGVGAPLGASEAQVKGLGVVEPVTATAAGIAGVSWGTIVIGVVVVVALLAISSIAQDSAFEAKVNSEQHALTVRERLAAYATCRSGGGELRTCAGIAATLVPSMSPPPGAEDPMWVSRLKKAAIYSGVALGVLAVGYLGVKLVAKRIDERPALRGLPSGAFSGARFPVKPSSRPGLRGVRGRTSLAGRRSPPRGKKGRGLQGREYNMEVMP